MNIEQFPTSESAKRMMSFITQNGWYDKSYVGKWLFQVMGLEMDEARQYVDELRLQAFPETATWGLKYHEIKYGLPVSEHLPIETRRQIIFQHRDNAYPLNPWRMERTIRNVSGSDVSVRDINDGAAVSHPNIFEVIITDMDGIDVGAVISKIKTIKQSHTTFMLYFGCDIGIRIHASTAPKLTISPMCGTIPGISTGGGIGKPTLRLGVAPHPWKTDFPLPNDEELTGKYPIDSTMLVMNRGDIRVESSEVEALVESTYAGYVNAGEEPIQSAGLVGGPGSLDMGVAGNAYASESRMCGEEW